jgi:ABC-2 type transport system ATP-binding protein
MDPQARRMTWGVIRALRREGVTVLLTTHFMEDAEQLADRVAILHRGRLLALDTPAGLRRESADEVRFHTAPAVSERAVTAALELETGAVSRENDGTLVIRAEPSPELVARLTAWLETEGVLLTELRAGSRSLEQAFLDITSQEQDEALDWPAEAANE